MCVRVCAYMFVCVCVYVCMCGVCVCACVSVCSGVCLSMSAVQIRVLKAETHLAKSTETFLCAFSGACASPDRPSSEGETNRIEIVHAEKRESDAC